MRHRFPPPIIRHAIWLDLRFTQLVRKLLKKRGFAPLLVVIDKLPSYTAVLASAPELPP
jgi:transposase-like protein